MTSDTDTPVAIDDIEVPQDVIDEVAQDASPPKEIQRANPAITARIVDTVRTVRQEVPEGTLAETLYLAAKQVLIAQGDMPTGHAFAGILFSYYLEAYRAYRVIVEQYNPRDLKIYNEAAASVFDVYFIRSEEVIARRLLKEAANGLKEIGYTRFGAAKDVSMEQAMTIMANATFLVDTLSDYTSGRLRRLRNKRYLMWLKTYLQELASTLDTEALLNNATLKQVIPQIQKRKTAIIIA